MNHKLKYTFLCLIILFTIKSYSQEHQIQSYFFLKNTAYVELEDHSIWQLVNIQSRSRTWNEWWNSVEVSLDSEYIWNKDSWNVNNMVYFGSSESVDFPTENISEYDRERISSCNYIMESYDTGKKAFAKQISLDALVNKFLQFAKSEYNTGYDKGYNTGYNRGYNAGHDDRYNHNQYQDNQYRYR